MEWITIISLVSGLLSISTISGLFWKDLHDKKKGESDERKKKRNEEERQMLATIIREENEAICSELKSLSSKVDKIADGTLCTLRNDILTCYYKCVDKKYRNDYDYTNIHDLYNAYVALHGNSFVEDVMKRFGELPTKEEYMLKKTTQIREEKEESA